MHEALLLNLIMIIDKLIRPSLWQERDGRIITETNINKLIL